MSERIIQLARALARMSDFSERYKAGRFTDYPLTCRQKRDDILTAYPDLIPTGFEGVLSWVEDDSFRQLTDLFRANGFPIVN